MKHCGNILDARISYSWFWFYTYILAAIFNWGYWIWLAMQLKSPEPGSYINDLTGTAIIFGWIPAILWPLHVVVLFWAWVL